MGTGKLNAGGKPCDGLASHPGGGGCVEILLVASCYCNQDKLWPDELFGSCADFTFLPFCYVLDRAS